MGKKKKKAPLPFNVEIIHMYPHYIPVSSPISFSFYSTAIYQGQTCLSEVSYM